MVDSLVTVALETLRDLLIEEVKLLSGVFDQVKQVETDLRTMHSFLREADKWSNKYEPASLQNWIIDLQKLASDAENVLEKYAIEVASKKEGKNLKKKLKRFICILSECFSVHQVGKETEAIRSRLAVLTDRLRSMSGGEGSSYPADKDQQHLLRLKYAHEVEQHFVGMDDDIKRLVSMVKDDKRCSPVISIYGMGGLGKTTLARKIYHHKDVQCCFEACAWVCVTQQFQVEIVLREILKQFLSDDKKEQIKKMEHRELVVELHNFLVQRKCLIVIDDIWEIDHWNILKPAFPTNCKLLLTTRRENIVSQECLYKLDFLTEDQGWELLQKTALLKDDAPVLEAELRSLEVIGRRMVQKCGCLPLAISVIGGILCQKQTLPEWEKVSSNIDSYLKHGEGVGNNTSVTQVLDLSYDVLPYYLKPCFLYLGCFGEDEEINVETLYLLWMAEGLISSEDKGSNETLRDVAERYLTELAFRCMVQVEKDEFFTAYNKYSSCRLHDLMHDLCSSKGEEQKFVKRIDFGKHTKYVPSSGTTISRLAISFDGVAGDCLGDREKLENLRSLLVLQKGFSSLPIGSKDSIINFNKSKFLRILRLENCLFESLKLPAEVSKLIHLRYLSLFDSDVDELPSSVCHDMPYLRTLDLRVCNYIKLPNVIYKMKRLKHLFLTGITVMGGDKLILDGLKELETLDCGITKMICFADIPKLINLQNLRVQIMEDMDTLSIIVHHMISNQSQLLKTHLSIVYCDFSSEKGKNVFRKMLMSYSLVSLKVQYCVIDCGYQQGMCKNLVALQLFKCQMGGDVMETLGKYPVLKKLVLAKCRVTKMICGANSFPELTFLGLCGLLNLKKWEMEERAMPKLTALEIIRFFNLEMIPDGLRFLSTLRKLKTQMPKEFNNRLRVVDDKPGEDYHKICHIPSIDLFDEEKS